MTNKIKPQRLVVHTHDSKKLFHVSLHNDDISDAASNWKSVACKAKYAYETLATGKRSDNERALTGGLHIAMINTNYSGWDTVKFPGNYSLKEAFGIKDDLIEQYENLGFTNVGVRTAYNKVNPTSDGLGGQRWTKKFNVANMTKAKIDEKINWINTSLGMPIPQNVRNSAYLSIVRANGSIDNMATLLLYIRQKVGLV
jgi:hypothetical protein